MAIDVTKIIEQLQLKEETVTSSSTVDELALLFRAAKKASNVVIRTYDSDGSFPDATTTKERIAFNAALGELRFNDNTGWKSAAEVGTPGAAVGDDLIPYQGTNYGYSTGGNGNTDRIQKYSLVSDGNATVVATLTLPKDNTVGNSSTVNGYASGGYTSPPIITYTAIEKFQFSTDGNGVVVADLATTKTDGAPQSDGYYGFISGGSTAYSTTPSSLIQKFPYATDTDATAVGDLISATPDGAGQSSDVNGYASGGTVIEKFPFAAEVISTRVIGKTLGGRIYGMRGASSTTHGFSASSLYSSPTTPIGCIERFSFTSDGDTVDLGDLTILRYGPAPASSTTHGYNAHGRLPTSPGSNVIDKYSFTSVLNATDVGDLTTYAFITSGQHY